MGIIFPKKQNGLSKVLITLLLIILFPLLLIPVLFYFLWGAILYLTIRLTAKKAFVVFAGPRCDPELVSAKELEELVSGIGIPILWRIEEFQSDRNGFSTFLFCDDLSIL